MSTLTLNYSVDDQKNVHIDKPGPQELPLTLTVAPRDKDATIDAINVFLAGADAGHIGLGPKPEKFNHQIIVSKLPIELKVEATKGGRSDSCFISLAAPLRPTQRSLSLILDLLPLPPPKGPHGGLPPKPCRPLEGPPDLHHAPGHHKPR